MLTKNKVPSATVPFVSTAKRVPRMNKNKNRINISRPYISHFTQSFATKIYYDAASYRCPFFGVAGDFSFFPRFFVCKRFRTMCGFFVRFSNSRLAKSPECIRHKAEMTSRRVWGITFFVPGALLKSIVRLFPRITMTGQARCG